MHQDSQTSPQTLIPLRPIFRRSIYIIGLMLRFFNFTDKDVYGDAYPVSFYINFYILKIPKQFFYISIGKYYTFSIWYNVIFYACQ